ncbi:MAG: hypothetical protein NUV34_05020 [Sulfuricaulis sp.]|nr:hypothetical protein [Sulfuricaulis sp.]
MKDTLTHFLAMVVAVILTVVTLITFTFPERDREVAARVQRDAAKAGAATYLVAEDGTPMFTWRVCAGVASMQTEKGK